MSIADNLRAVRASCGQARLIAVSKTRSSDEIAAAIAAGQRIFGENRVQEAQAKFPELRARHGELELHLIGPLQTNKARDAVELFDVIQTLDRPRLADALKDAMDKTGKRPRLYIEVNIGREAQKAGCAPEDVAAFLADCRAKGLEISGLMCIPPHEADPRPYFEQLRDMAGALGLPHISMGMSADYDIAAACGATEVRVGTAIFGERNYNPSR